MNYNPESSVMGIQEIFLKIFLRENIPPMPLVFWKERFKKNYHSHHLKILLPFLESDKSDKFFSIHFVKNKIELEYRNVRNPMILELVA